MTKGAALSILRAGMHGRVEEGADIAPLTSYRLGGPAAIGVEAATDADLDTLADAVEASGLPMLVVGRGSNMLVSDRGFPGIVVRLGGGFRWSVVEGTTVGAGAAMPLPALATAAMQATLTGLEFAVAIPASLGGAVRMNAGAHGNEIADVMLRAEVFVMGDRSRRTIAAADAGFAYRHSGLPADAIVTAAWLGLAAGDPERILEKMNEAKRWRRETQPVNLPNGGSVFKNPPGDKAGRLVETVCGKGMAVGGARVSEVHANFIVADATARADEVYTLIRRIQRMVVEQTGIHLETELKLIGEFEEVADG